ncbi:uncharacterized protein EI90DRAFT_2493348 [Cantharellus anzutake]|uniref:uncharacterized protein n=1 Tax=Cantharellus anzutake TaxID=1750568 RepID=UPI001906585B|nr:uncharacterized protein EI90DRAFT_2493348 [Cantharellus anzutake]KAF8321934.1 hypothetical protein EI90DRAFT_2493348 [Cantharellus anzutake]
MPNLHNIDVSNYSEIPDVILGPLMLRFEDISNDHSTNSKREWLEMIPPKLRLSSVEETLCLARSVFMHKPSTRYDDPVYGQRYPNLGHFFLQWQWDDLGSRILISIMASAGYNSETMTFTQLLEENIHVECVTCTLAGSATILEAAKAVHHGHNCFRRFLYGGEEPRFRVLEGMELESARASSTVNGQWECLLCKPCVTDSEDMILEHIASAHPNARPDLQYCYKGPNHQTPRKPIPVRLALEGR